MTDDTILAGPAPVFDAANSEGFLLPDLPYGYADLEPVISETALRTHHLKHHARYVETVNRILDAEGRPIHYLADVVRDAEHRKATALFNNAAQAWNHGFFWESMSPKPTQSAASLAGAIVTSFGGSGALKARFIAEGTGHFGSGWVWLVARGADLSIYSTHDAATPLTTSGVTPLLVCDLWEHAYYLDYRQDRATWLGNWWDKLANWQHADRQYAAAIGRSDAWRYPAAR